MAFTDWVELLQTRAATHPDTLLYRFLEFGDVDGPKVEQSYAEFESRVRAIAAHLQAHCAVGDRALLLYAPGIDFVEGFFGCLYAGVIAVPAYPPDPSRLARTVPRLRGIVADSQPRFVLTTSFVASFAEALMPQAPELAELSWLSTDQIDTGLAQDWNRPAIDTDTLAFLQYTSGSTGRPKGVMLSHRNLLVNEEVATERLQLTGDQHMVSWLPQYHDMGLIGCCINPMFNGFGCTIMAPMSFLQKPVRWMQAMSRFKGTVTAGPNFSYDLVVRKIKDEELAELDLSSWRVAVNGAEPVRAEVAERFLARFGPVGFKATASYPSYGMAEATLFISAKKVDEVFRTLTVDEQQLQLRSVEPVADDHPDGVRLVSCGTPNTGHEIAIVDTDTLLENPKLKVGEIWLRGGSNAQGYWRREEETERTFGARLEGRGEGTWLRTGDLGFLDQDGEVYITGRDKDLIIIRGRNHYPQDIEFTVEECDPAMRPGCSAAYTLEVRGEERLAVSAEVDPRRFGQGRIVDMESAIRVVRAEIAETHGIQPHAISLLKSRTIPKTTSGKIQRHGARLEFLDGSGVVLHQWVAELAEEQPAADLGAGRSRLEIQAWLTGRISSFLGLKPRDIDPSAPFTQHGLDSLQAVELMGELEQFLDLRVPTSAIWDHPSVVALANHFAADTVALDEILGHERSDENIAVVGLGCRFPGAASPKAFWKLLSEGVDAISEAPAGRWNDLPGGYIEHVEDFDPDFFGLSPREARGMDPQQRLLLEVCWEALESAGISPDSLAGSSTGVFVGIASTDYSLLSIADPDNADAYSGTGNAHSIAANRLSYLLDLRGPSMALDTACSSSLVALHQAVAALRSGEVQRAIVGGVNLLVAPQASRAFQKAGMLAPDARCKTFDASADGYVRGEGCGVLILERLSTAESEGDRVHALIRGSALNQDGRSNGLTAPSGTAQRRVIRAALADAGAAPDDIGYVEAHGTGTPLGDPIEVNALSAVIGEREGPCWLGSVKTNVGHLEAAAGMAAVIKVVLAMQQGEIPPQLHFSEANPGMDLGALEVTVETQTWPEGKLAGVSGFGFGGTNAHVVLEPAPRHAASEPGRELSLLTLSARSEDSLHSLAAEVRGALAQTPEDDLADFCYSLNVGRASMRHRLAIIARGKEELSARLADLESRKVVRNEAPPSPPKLAFLFTGQGSQYLGMGMGLYESEPVFKETLDACDEQLGDSFGASLLEILRGEDPAVLNHTAVTQPALFSLQVALARLWQSWGVQPEAVTGHSVGAYAAAVVAGVLSLEDGLRLVAARGRLMGALPEGGAMAAVQATEAQVAEVIADLSESVGVAAINGPEQIVISGLERFVEQALDRLSAAGFLGTRLSVSHAFHSALMDPMLLEFTELVSGIEFSAPKIPLVSDHDGSLLDGERVRDPLYWRDHVRHAIRFKQTMEGLDRLGCQLYVEIGPSPVLLGMGRRCLPEAEAAWLPSLRKGREDHMVLLRTLAEAAAAGLSVDWEGFEGQRARRKLDLPTSPYQRRRCWVEEGPRGTIDALRIEWEPAPAEAGDLAGDWVILGTHAELGVALEAAGGRVVEHIGPDCRGVIDVRALAGGDAETLCSQALSSLKQQLGDPVAPVFLVTRGAQSLHAADVVDPNQAALWGLGRAVAQRQPERWGGLVDLDGTAEVEAILAELGSPDCQQAAWRGGERHVARLVPCALPARRTPIDPEASYLVTGGLGDLGLHVAGWLQQQGAKHLVLTSRRGQRSPAVDALEEAGAKVTVAAVDVADGPAMTALVASLPKLKGIVHAAGVVERVLLEDLDDGAFQSMLRAKVAGSRVIDSVSRDLELDFLVFFSSVSALWGGQGLLAYASANAFQDGLAAARASEGLPALSLGWGVWADGGMATDEERVALARLGLHALAPAEALRRMAGLLGQRGHLALADVDWTRLRPVLEARSPAPLFARLGLTRSAVDQGSAELLQRLLGAESSDRKGLLTEAVRDEVRRVAELDTGAAVPLDEGFFDLGLDSLMAVEMKVRLEGQLGLALPATLLMDQPDLGRLVDWLMAELDLGGSSQRVVRSGMRSEEPIALIGMACKLPGGATTPELLWELLCSGRDAVAEVPADRWDIDAWYDPAPESAGKMYARRGGFVEGADQFDAGFFGITAREAKRMDPQHRWLLETAWQALENAGQCPARSGTMQSGGVFVGIGSSDYLQKVVGSLPSDQVDAWTGTGNAMAFAAGRLAFHLGLQGPAMALDTACSSSLVATHLACQSLRNGECEMALAGGVNLILDPEVSVYLSRARALSPDGRCKAFDARADGYVRGEGCGVVVLKRLSDAQRDGDRVLALVRGSAVNHDGRSSGITVPNGPAQQEVIRAALDCAGLEPSAVGYVEAHGTGTGLGDPIEVGALAAVLGTERPMVVGTIKSNLGHLEAASGIAGLIKAVLCVERGAIPPNLHFETINPHIDSRIPLEVPTSTRSWPASERVAGISAFGLSGTNAHVLVSEAPASPQRQGRTEGPWVLPVSAHTPVALSELRDEVLAVLDRDGLQLVDLCRSLAGRAQLSHRLAPVAEDLASLRAALAEARPLEVQAVPRQAPELSLPETPGASEMASLFLQGVQLDWKAFYGAGRSIPLPNTPLQRKRHWLEVKPSTAAPPPPVSAEPLLGERLALPLIDTVVFEAKHRPASPVWLDHHRLFGRVVTPGAAHIALALAAARQSRGLGSCSIAEVSFSRALILADDEIRTVQIALDGHEGEVAFKVGSVLPDGSAQLHASGRLLAQTAELEPLAESLDAIRARLDAKGPSEAFYEDFARVGYTLGAAFRWMNETWRVDGEALCRMAAPAQDIGLRDAPLHPGLIDSCFQLLTRCLPEEQVAEVLDGSSIFVPVGVERFSWLGSGEGELWAHARLREPQVADIWLRDAEGGVHACIEGLRVARIPRTVLGGKPPAPDDVYEQRWLHFALEDEERGASPSSWALLDYGAGTGAALAATLESRGHSVDLVGPDRRAPSAEIVVDLRGLSLGATEGVDELLDTVRALPDKGSRLVVLTRGAVGLPAEVPELSQVALLGLQRVIAMERPGLRCTHVDLDPALPKSAVAALADELEANVDADQVALRLSGRSVARLLERSEGGEAACSHWTVGQPGSLESVLSHPARRSQPGPGEVEISVRATGLNFRDVLGALGAYPGDPGPLGGECSGVISSLGSGVSGLSVGDRVVTLLANTGCFRTHAVSDARFVAKLPESLGFEAAATLPVAYATAAYGLEHLAKLSADDRVLIHAASGGVGMAAVQIAQAAGAEIFATAGSESKRRVLRELGIQHVFDSRSLDYVARIRDLTGGLDVVLNSLGAEHVRECLALTAPGGRFVEIGKADVLDETRVAGLGKPLSYFHFDLVTMSQREPELIHQLLVEAMDRFAAGGFRALPLRSFQLEETVTAFRHMARARHVGKVVVGWPEPFREAPIRADRSYLVTGGLGALGLELASWLVEQGARELLLIGRSAPSDEARRAIAAMVSSGARVDTAQVDVTDRAALERVIPAKLAGVFHCAGVLDDALIDEQGPARVERVMGVKRDGAWNLHQLTGDLDHFVLFSSASALLGSAGQASYAAANAWLDGLAAWRRSQGLPALSVAWGPWAAVGMAAQTEGTSRWSRVGISPLSAEQALQTLGVLMQSETARAAVLPIDRAKMARGLSLGPIPPLMLELLELEQGGDERAQERFELRDEVLGASDPEQRFDAMVDYLCCCLATVTEEDEVDPEAPLDDNDSLVAVEFTALVEKELSLSLPMEEVFELENLMDVAEMVGDLLARRP